MQSFNYLVKPFKDRFILSFSEMSIMPRLKSSVKKNLENCKSDLEFFISTQSHKLKWNCLVKSGKIRKKQKIWCNLQFYPKIHWIIDDIIMVYHENFTGFSRWIVNFIEFSIQFVFHRILRYNFTFIYNTIV